MRDTNAQDIPPCKWGWKSHDWQFPDDAAETAGIRQVCIRCGCRKTTATRATGITEFTYTPYPGCIDDPTDETD